MSQRVLVVGATGRIGRHFVGALLGAGHSVVAMVRAENSHSDTSRNHLLQRFRQEGVTVIEGSLEDESSLDRACQGANAVISCIDHRPDHLRLQSNLAKAAGRARTVRRILPSQFGIDSRLYGNARVDHGDLKRELQQVFAGSGVPATFVHCNGLASEWVGSLGQLGLPRPPAEEVELYGQGDVKFSMTAAEDVARYAVRTLMDGGDEFRHVVIAPPDNTLNQTELINLWEKKSGRTLRKTAISREALDDRIRSLGLDPKQRPQLAMAQLVRAAWIDGLGDGRRLPDVVELSGLYPNLSYLRIGAFLDRYLLSSSSVGGTA